MNKNWWMPLVVAVLICSALARWYSGQYARNRTAQCEKLLRDREELSFRMQNAVQERRRYSTLSAAADRLEARVRWAADPTSAIQWFAATAEEEGVRLANSQLVASKKRNDLAANGAFRRMAFEMLLEGEYGPLTAYVDRVERAPHPMLIERLEMLADRRETGQGSLRLTVACVFPAERAADKPDAAQSAEGEKE